MLSIPELGAFDWPSNDVHCKDHLAQRWGDAKKPMQYVTDRRVCIQAGGNCGVWPKYLSTQFDTVYTFEPDPTNFNYLCRNVQEINVVKLNAALGYKRGCIYTYTPKHETNNIGAYQCNRGGFVPVLRIDDLCVPACDLIQLDIEGMELDALRGAEETINQFFPVIMIEDKGLSETYGVKQGEAVKFLEDIGYKIVENVKRDIILCKKELSV